MLPPILALNATDDGAITVEGTSAGSVPAAATDHGGMAVKADGTLYVVYA